MSAKAPAFLNKPNHKGNVVATSRGWVVEETGELLVSVKNLDQRIAEHLGLPSVQLANCLTAADVVVPDAAIDVAVVPEVKELVNPVDALLEENDEKVKEDEAAAPEEAPAAVAETPAPKRRGRPPKVRTEEAAK